jgi:hypothetical protein
MEKLEKYLAISEWGRPDAESILGAADAAVERGIGAISVLDGAASVLASLSPPNTKMFAFTDDPEKVPQIAERGLTPQLWTTPGDLDNAPLGAILSFALKDIEHLCWDAIMQKPAAGFMLLDEGGKYQHRFYDFLTMIGDEFSGEVHYCGGQPDAGDPYFFVLENALRLVGKVRPGLLPGLRLFAPCGFLDNRNKTL